MLCRLEHNHQHCFPYLVLIMARERLVSKKGNSQDLHRSPFHGLPVKTACQLLVSFPEFSE